MNQRPAFPSPFQAVLLYLALFLAEIVIGAVLRDANRILGLSLEQAGALTLVMANGCVFVVVMQFQQLTYRDLLHRSSASATATLALIVPPVLLLVPALLLTMSVTQEVLVNLFPFSRGEEAGFEQMLNGSFAMVTIVCILAPILEEMLFRGIVLRGFLEHYPRRQAILWSAVMFGAAHLNIYQFVTGLVAGCLLGWLYERTRSLIPGIALHAAFNSGAMVMSAWAKGPPGNAPLGATLPAWAMSLAAAACGAFALRRMLTTRATTT